MGKGYIPLCISNLCLKRCFLALLESRRRTARPLSVVQSTYAEGVSTCKGDELLQALGLTSTEKSRVKQVCQQLDVGTFITAFWGKTPLRVAGCAAFEFVKTIISEHGIVLAIWVHGIGKRELLISAVSSSEEAFSDEFLCSLVSMDKGVRRLLGWIPMTTCA